MEIMKKLASISSSLSFWRRLITFMAPTISSVTDILAKIYKK